MRAVLLLVADALERRSDALVESDPVSTLDIVRQKTEVSRDLDDAIRIAEGLATQAILLARFLDRRREAVPLAEEARVLARAHGLDDLDREMLRILADE